MLTTCVQHSNRWLWQFSGPSLPNQKLWEALPRRWREAYRWPSSMLSIKLFCTHSKLWSSLPPSSSSVPYKHRCSAKSCHMTGAFCKKLSNNLCVFLFPFLATPDPSPSDPLLIYRAQNNAKMIRQTVSTETVWGISLPFLLSGKVLI